MKLTDISQTAQLIMISSTPRIPLNVVVLLNPQFYLMFQY